MREVLLSGELRVLLKVPYVNNYDVRVCAQLFIFSISYS
jgi:hypothetical protein